MAEFKHKIALNVRGFLFGKSRSQAGFTLIELLVAIAIFTSLSTFLIVSYHDNEKSRTLKNQAQELIAGLQKVQNMALTGESINSLTPLSYRFTVADCDGNCSYRLAAVFADSSTVDISQTALRSVAIQTFLPSGLSVDFSSPRGKMVITPNDAESAYFQISNDQASDCVKINAVSGRIDLASGACN